MKTIIITLSLLSFGSIWSQNAPSFTQQELAVKSNDLSELTEIMLHKYYSEEDVKDIKENYPDKLMALDYYYSHSFKVVDGQTYTHEQLLKIDVTTFGNVRVTNQATEIYDEVSQLHLLLDSQNTLKTTFVHIMYPNGQPNYTQKYNPE